MFLLGKIISKILIILVILRIELSFAQIVCRDINQILLKNTNDKRALHKAPALTLNLELVKSSHQYAQQLASECSLHHAGGAYGEKLILTAGNQDFNNYSTDFGAINAFYSEIECYCGYETNCPPCVYGHFTQLIWESSKTQGCGACLDQKTKCFVIVCRYLPQGNVVGAYESNVKPPYGTQPPIWEIFQKAKTKDLAIAGGILAVFFAIVVFTFILHHRD